MTCPRIFEPVDAQHLETCADCRAARAALDIAAPAGASLDALKGPALAAFKASPRARPWWAGALGFTLATVVAAGIAMQLLPAHTAQHASLMLRQVSAAGWAITMMSGCML